MSLKRWFYADTKTNGYKNNNKERHSTGMVLSCVNKTLIQFMTDYNINYKIT